MPTTTGPLFRWTTAIAIVFLLVAAIGAYTWREEILRTSLDPKQPFQTYRPPKAPNYADASAWAIRPVGPTIASGPPADVFFVHPTTYDGGRDWNAPIDQPAAQKTLARVMLPNYAGPFQRVARVFAPRYRQASLYASSLTLRDDARDARRFAYGDVRAAFLAYMAHDNGGRPLILAGTGQGAKLVSHLVQDVVAPDSELRSRIVAVYLMDAVTLAADYAPGSAFRACEKRNEARCTIGWKSVKDSDPLEPKRVLDRSLIWTKAGQLINLAGRPSLCVNPLTGAGGGALVSAHQNLGAANASGLEWGVRPPFMPHQVSAQCVEGLLHVSRPPSPSLQLSGSWTDRRKAAPFNVFYADIEADARARVNAYLGRDGYRPAAPAIVNAVEVTPNITHHID